MPNIQLNDIRQEIEQNVRIALAEDVGSGDISAALIPANKTNTAQIITRENAVLCGSEWLNETFRQLGGIETIEWHAKDGDNISANSPLVTLTGKSRSLLTGERTALNFLQLLSGIATKSRNYANLVKDTDIQILDTRKTLPGLRAAQKYAVSVGGCCNHRIGLYDMYMIKENHITACGSIADAVAQARKNHPEKHILVETETLEELQAALLTHPEVVMLDNFSAEQLEQASKIAKGNTLYEVSGGITEDHIQSMAKTAVDRISTGALTKAITPVDLSMRIIK